MGFQYGHGLRGIAAAGSIIAIDILAVERGFVETQLDQRRLEYLISIDPDVYAELY